MCHISAILAKVTWGTGEGLKTTGQRQTISFIIFLTLSENRMKKKKKKSRCLRENQHIDFSTEEGNNVFAL